MADKVPAPLPAHPCTSIDSENARTFADRARRFGIVIWIFAEHTFYIVLFCAGIWLIGEFLKLIGVGHRKLPIPFFPQAVELEDALFLMDFVVLVLFYYIAFREIAQLYNIRFRGLPFLVSRRSS
jgi:hypothetical protein